MSDSSNNDKTSVASFLFMPQVGKMFEGSSYMVPVFIRTIANLYVQAGLLPPTHPAANYGARGVEKCSFSQMMGDAWYTVRTTAATPYQWSIFCSVLLMMFVMISSLIVGLLNLSMTYVSTAGAQVFTGPLGPNTTDILSIPALGAPCTANTPFCRVMVASYMPGTGHADYAIDILDKMLRRGASGVAGNASPLQTSVGALMQIYNSGILVVAGIMLFWLIISVVVDIARTGQIGGGRHNLVWAPIRIVFALGMLIPLGTSGFSSGQFVVMKIAEWGSNFGTNGWNAYLAGIAKTKNILPSLLPLGEDLMPLVGSYERMWVCRVAFNGYGYQAEGLAFNTPTPAQVVYLHPDTGQADAGRMSYAYTNDTADDICGRVIFPTGNDPALLEAANPTPPAVADPVAQASAKFKIAMDQAWMKVFVGGYTGGNTPNTMVEAVPLARIANNFACGFVAQHLWGQVAGSGIPDVLGMDCGQGGIATGAGAAPQCGSGAPGSGKYPTMVCVDNPANEFDTATMTGVIGQAIYQAATAQLATLNALPVNVIFGTKGWADMGSFYKSISTLTVTVNGSMKIPVHVSAPGIQDGSDNQSAKVEEVLGKFDDWWKTVPNGQPGPNPPANCGANPPTPGCPTRAHHNGGCGFLGMGCVVHFVKSAAGGVASAVGTGIHIAGEAVNFAKKVIPAIAGLAGDPAGALLSVVEGLVKDEQGKTFMAIPPASDPNHVNDYPLEIVSHVGTVLIDIALIIYTAITTAELVAALVPMTDIGATLASSLLAHLMSIIGDAMMMCGSILCFYLPLLPFFRVAHAVLTWMVAVFEAVMLVPIAALAFLDTEHEGMYNKLPFINWLDILVRPILTVIGYVGSILVFDAFFAYFQDSFGNAVGAEVAGTTVLFHIAAMFINAVLFTLIMYTAANTCFKMLNSIPNAFFRWIPGGSPPGFQEQGGDHAGAVGKMGSMTNQGVMKASGGENAMRKGIRHNGQTIAGGTGGKGGASEA